MAKQPFKPKAAVKDLIQSNFWIMSRINVIRLLLNNLCIIYTIYSDVVEVFTFKTISSSRVIIWTCKNVLKKMSTDAIESLLLTLTVFLMILLTSAMRATSLHLQQKMNYINNLLKLCTLENTDCLICFSTQQQNYLNGWRNCSVSTGRKTSNESLWAERTLVRMRLE